MEKKDQTVRFQYVHVNRRRNPTIIAYQAKEDKEQPGNVKITFGASFCNKKDPFNRGFGRSIAEQRLFGENHIVLSGNILEGESYSQAVVRLIRDYVSYSHTQVMSRFCQKQ